MRCCGGSRLFASSIEYHARCAGEMPGTGLLLADGMQEALIALGHAARHVPRDSHDTLWRWNTGGKRIRFTGDDQENVFAHGVIETDRMHADSCAMIRPICWGSEPLVSPQAVEALRRARGEHSPIVRHLCCVSLAEYRLEPHAGIFHEASADVPA